KLPALSSGKEARIFVRIANQLNHNGKSSTLDSANTSIYRNAEALWQVFKSPTFDSAKISLNFPAWKIR
ncbi:MAG: hypothetical protein WC957_06480, partial [Candidatus Neomarinimicrobiota bacterium]